jgi:hypothetical protein
MELDKAFKSAVILAWDDLMKVGTPSFVRVDYECEPGVPLDSLCVLTDQTGGRQDVLCDYWTSASSAHPSGIRFRDGGHSDNLALNLDFIMKNQDRFTRPPDACRHGLVLIHPPAVDERAEVSACMSAVRGDTPAAVTS